MKEIITLILILTSLVSFGQSHAIEALWKQYQLRNYDLVIAGAEPILESEPIDMNLLLGRAYTDKGEYEKAIPHLKYTIDADDLDSWRKEWALGYLGTCQFALQQYDNSKESLEKCINMNFTRDATRYALKQIRLFGLDDFYKNWKTVESDNFKSHFQNMSDHNITKYIQLREKAYKNINDFFKSTLLKKIDFFVWESKEDGKKMLYVNLDNANPDFCIVHSHYQQTTGCELAYVMSNYSVPIQKKTEFISRGVAVYLDQTNEVKEQTVKEWLKSNNEKIDIKDVWNYWQFYPYEFSYPLAGLFVGELIDNFGKDNFLKFFKEQNYENAKLIFGGKLDVVIQNFENKINK